MTPQTVDPEVYQETDLSDIEADSDTLASAVGVQMRIMGVMGIAHGKSEYKHITMRKRLMDIGTRSPLVAGR